MSIESEPNGGKPAVKKGSRIIHLLFLIMLVLNLGLAGWIARPYLYPIQPTPTSVVENTPSISIAPASATPVITATDTPAIDSTSSGTEIDGIRSQGIFILAMKDGNYSHLFGYHPQYFPLTRLTNSEWDDITPAASPDGKRLVFSSRRNGYWDLYLLDLTTGDTQRLTDTPEYDASPTWSPDNQWIGYESYQDGSLEIMIRSLVDASQPVIQLTSNLNSAEFSPVWSPEGRDIAFVSDQSGDQDIWLAHLDRIDERFLNISNTPESNETLPSWSPDGRFLTWVSESNGDRSIFVWDSQNPDRNPRNIGNGNWPVWNPEGKAILTVIQTANEYALTVIDPLDGSLLSPMTRLPSELKGLAWLSESTADLLQNFPFMADSLSPSPQLWETRLTVYPLPPGGRFGVVPLNDVEAPYAYLHDAADESFTALRERTAQEAGWDVLSSLENAYVALTEPPTPSMIEDWLYTGRAIAINSLPIYAGWMVIAREQYEGQTYWRYYLKARYQDGSQGEPIKTRVWDLNARFSGDTQSYEDGGKSSPAPAGYWIDFTELSARYGWERLPALANWRSFYPAARFNYFVFREDLDWKTAMSELYPPEALATPTSTRTYTPTVTDTPENYRPSTPTPSATITPTATLHFTFTPAP